ncbi:MAG: hypothetical protein MK074_04925 [Phycisphaerales bacterium]|nr:hypothetical protein [Phycisphaerales bacterium]
MRFVSHDLLTGQTTSLDLSPEDLCDDRAVIIALDANTDTGRHGMGLVWTDELGEVEAARLDILNSVDFDFDPTTVRFRADVDQVSAARTTSTAVDAMARIEIDATGPEGELFDMLQTDRVQADPVNGIPGDIDADGIVLVHDLLQVVSALFNSCLPEEDCYGDVDGDGVVNVQDILIVLQHYGETSGYTSDAPSRLIHFQLVGGSHTDADPNFIHPNVYNDEDGWQALIENNLALISEQAPDGWDMWLHNPGGYWFDHDYTWRAPDGETQPMVFEQLKLAREHRPGLLELDAVRQWMDGIGGRMYGYVGLPRTYDSPTGDWSAMPDHGAPDLVDKWYGDLLQQGFSGVGHDASAHHPSDSAWYTEMVPELRARGVEVFLESIPRRNSPHLLGQSVVAEHRLWEDFSGDCPQWFYTPEEIKAAGGRAIHLVIWPSGMSPNESGYDPDFDLLQWQLDTSVELLEAGETVAVNLAGLVRHGYDISPIITAAQ